MIRSKNTPIIRKDLDEGVLGEANMDGSVYVDKSVKPDLIDPFDLSILDENVSVFN